MNKKILHKILSELTKDAPDISYVKGILETLIESLPEEAKPMVIVPGISPKIINVDVSNDPEMQILEAKARADAQRIQEIMGTSVVTEN